ncbi:MAG: amidase [Firmicutes bacterium]|nr:amidase [Bacillota bacterium]
MSSIKDFCYMPATVIADRVKTKKVSPTEVVKTFLERIDMINPLINAYCTVAEESALRAARELEEKIKAKIPIGSLAGVPVSIKDVTLTKGIRTTFGSLLYKDYVPQIDSLVVERLKAAGAIIMGKTNTPEFAAGGSTYNDLFGPTRTPWNTAYNSGGSSGGSAAAVAAGLCALAEGNDLGGSLRIPASFCGIVGMRPSPGRIPFYPNDLYWDTMSLEGPMARNVEDLALMFDVLAGPDRRSPVALMPGEESFHESLKMGLGSKCSFKVAWSDNLNLTPVDHEVLQVARRSIKTFEQLGCTVIEDCPDYSGLQETAAVLRGVRYAALYQDELEKPEFLELVNPNVISNARQGLALSAAAIAKADQYRSRLWQQMLSFFERYDLIAVPTVPIKPFPADTAYPTSINGQEMKSYIDWIMLTYAFSVTGLPAISIPCGWTKEGFPVGLQLAGKPGGERELLIAAACFESRQSWHDRRPPLND